MLAQLSQEGSSGARTKSLVTAWLFLALSPVVPAWRQLPSGTPWLPVQSTEAASHAHRP